MQLLFFCWKNVESFCISFSNFFNKNDSVFGYVVGTYLTSLPLNELVRLKCFEKRPQFNRGKFCLEVGRWCINSS